MQKITLTYKDIGDLLNKVNFNINKIKEQINNNNYWNAAVLNVFENAKQELDLAANKVLNKKDFKVDDLCEFNKYPLTHNIKLIISYYHALLND